MLNENIVASTQSKSSKSWSLQS